MTVIADEPTYRQCMLTPFVAIHHIASTAVNHQLKKIPIMIKSFVPKRSSDPMGFDGTNFVAH
jgi:hypothetical protein